MNTKDTLDMPANQDSETPITRKQRVLEARGQAVPLDLFLYSCLEYERLLNHNPEHQSHTIQWPRPSDFAQMPLTGLLAQLSAWYRDHHPAMAGRKPLDHEQLNDVVVPTVAFTRDVAALYRDRVGEDLPEYDKSVGNNKFWDDLIDAIQQAFPAYAIPITRFVQWAHAVEPVEDFEPGSRPPVGRYAPRMPRRDDSRPNRDGGGRGPRSGDRGPRGGDRGPRSGDRGPRGGAQGAPRGGHGGGDQQSRDRSERSPHRGPRFDRGEHPQRGGDRRPRRSRDDEANPKLEAAALAEVEQAIAQLKADANLDEVTLKPANSFYRRIQHQKIVDLGFHSFSVGEGPDRAVKVARKE